MKKPYCSYFNELALTHWLRWASPMPAIWQTGGLVSITGFSQARYVAMNEEVFAAESTLVDSSSSVRR